MFNWLIPVLALLVIHVPAGGVLAQGGGQTPSAEKPITMPAQSSKDDIENRRSITRIASPKTTAAIETAATANSCLNKTVSAP